MYSVKVTHNGTIRRCDDVAASYDTLLETIKSLFADLQLKSFCLTYQDNDGDIVTVSSDRELAVAIRVMSKMYDGILKFNASDVPSQLSAPTAFHFSADVDSQRERLTIPAQGILLHCCIIY